MDQEQILKTCLHEAHVALGAKMSPFAGYDMPIEYRGIVEEHNAVRNATGMFDVSHMGEIYIAGPEAARAVNHIFTGDVTALADGEVVYGMLTRPDGGVVDDLLVYRMAEDRYLLVVNAANIAKDNAWVAEHTKGYDVKVHYISDDVAEIALQGPGAAEVLDTLTDAPVSDLHFYTFRRCRVLGDEALVSRTGYTGEDGFEIYAGAATIQKLWQALQEKGVEPCGLGCRDTLRFEAGLPLYGHELADDITPIMAGLSMFCKLDKPEGFLGCEALKAQKAEGPARRSVGLEIHDRAIARAGSEVLNADDEVVGVVTTGYRGISVDKSLAVALVDRAYAAKGTELKVRVRRKTFPATVTARRFVATNYKK